LIGFSHRPLVSHRFATSIGEKLHTVSASLSASDETGLEVCLTRNPMECLFAWLLLCSIVLSFLPLRLFRSRDHG
jgi:hypothetical protein